MHTRKSITQKKGGSFTCRHIPLEWMDAGWLASLAAPDSRESASLKKAYYTRVPDSIPKEA